jgi:hypothetical protein
MSPTSRDGASVSPTWPSLVNMGLKGSRLGGGTDQSFIQSP